MPTQRGVVSIHWEHTESTLTQSLHILRAQWVLAVDDDRDAGMFEFLTLLTRDGFHALDTLLKVDSVPWKDNLL